MSQNRFRFRKDTVEAISPPDGKHSRETYHDTESRHLKLRVSAAGAKAFYFYKKHGGKGCWHKIGIFPDVSVSAARIECTKLAGQYAAGKDPRQAKADALTFGQLFERYMAGHAKPHKKTWQEDQRKHDTLFSAWDSRLAGDIDRELITRLHKRLGRDRGPYLANRTLALLKVVFSYGINTLGFSVSNPCTGVKPFKEGSRDRFLDREELKAFFAALDHEETPEQWRDFFSLSLWTGARRANVQAMQWDHLNLRTAIWEIPGEEFKNGEAFRVVLTAPALEILTRRKLDRVGASPFVFPANSKPGHVVEPRKAWRNVLKRAKLVDDDDKPTVRIHDLRRTLGSWQAATGASLQVIGKTLGHKDTATTAIYSRLNLDPVRSSMTVATDAMLKAVAGHE